MLSSSPITSWQIEGGKLEAVSDFIFLGSRTTEDAKFKRCFLLGKKDLTNLHSVLKSRHHFAYKCLYSQSYGFFQ